MRPRHHPPRPRRRVLRAVPWSGQQPTAPPPHTHTHTHTHTHAHIALMPWKPRHAPGLPPPCGMRRSWRPGRCHMTEKAPGTWGFSPDDRTAAIYMAGRCPARGGCWLIRSNSGIRTGSCNTRFSRPRPVNSNAGAPCPFQWPMAARNENPRPFCAGGAVVIHEACWVASQTQPLRWEPSGGESAGPGTTIHPDTQKCQQTSTEYTRTVLRTHITKTVARFRSVAGGLATEHTS